MFQSNLAIDLTKNSENQQEIERKKSVLTQDIAHDSRSDRYSLVKTSDVISMFNEAGFTHKLVAEERARKADLKGYTTHLVVFQNPQIKFNIPELDKEISPQIYFRNSYHGRSRILFYLGFLRFACMNGLVVGNIFDHMASKHIGIDQIAFWDRVMQFKTGLQDLSSLVLEMRNKSIDQETQMALAEVALKERFRKHEQYVNGEHHKLLTVNRSEDSSNNVWEVMNRIQENLGLNFGSTPVELNYQYEAIEEDGNKSIKERKMTRLSNIQEIIHLNGFLFSQAKTLASTGQLILA